MNWRVWLRQLQPGEIRTFGPLARTRGGVDDGVPGATRTNDVGRVEQKFYPTQGRQSTIRFLNDALLTFVVAERPLKVRSP